METVLMLKSPVAPVTLPSGNDHPVVDLPFTAVIDGRQFRGRGLSLVAAYVSGLMDPQAINAVRIVRLVFQFDGFSVALVAEAEVREHGDGSGTAELAFVHPTGAHLPQLRHILNAFIAGDLVGLGQTLGVAATAAPKAAGARPAPESRLSARRIAGGLGVGMLTAALIGLVGVLAWQRMFVTLVPLPGIVATTGEVLRATATGQIVFLDLGAARGDVAVAIQATSGDVQSLIMPCDCAVTANGLREGSTVLLGEPVAWLQSADDRTVVMATVPPDLLFGMMQADRVDLTFPDGATTQAQPLAGAPGQTAGALTLLPDTPLDAGRIGQPVQIRIRHDTGRIGAALDALAARVTTFGRGV